MECLIGSAQLISPVLALGTENASGLGQEPGRDIGGGDNKRLPLYDQFHAKDTKTDGSQSLPVREFLIHRNNGFHFHPFPFPPALNYPGPTEPSIPLN